MELINILHIDLRGVVTSMFGAILSLFFWNGNGFDWKRTAGIALASMFTGGYTVTVLEQYIALPALVHLFNIALGFLASDILSSIKTQAPTITNAVVEWLLRKGRAILGAGDRPPSPPPPKPPAQS